MSIRDVAKAVYFSVYSSRPVLAARLRKLSLSNSTTILNFHRVAEPDGSIWPSLSPIIFDSIIGYLKDQFSLRTFGTLQEPSAKPKMVLSFDDGYKDFIEYAIPILDKHRVKVNHNIIPGAVLSGLPPLNVMLSTFIGQAPREIVSRLEVPGMEMSDPSNHRKLPTFVKNKSQTEQEMIRSLLLPQLSQWEEFRPVPMMTLDDILEIASEHEIGAHSYDHASMEYETDDYLRDDLRKCSEYFSRVIGLPMNIYAFPNGSALPSQVAIARDYVDHVLLVENDFSTHSNIHHRFNFDATNMAEARYRAAGYRRKIPA